MNRFRRKRNEDVETYEKRAPLFVLLGSLLLYFLRFEYDYANSDQDEVIPFLLHRLDPGLFTQDWFVGIQMSEFSVRTYFVWLLNAFSLIIPVWLTVLLFYVVSWLFMAAAIYKLTYHFTRDQLAGCAAIVLALVLTPVWTLGGNDLVHSMLVASMLSWTLGLWAVYHFLRSRYLISPVLLGIACWIQALVGLHLAILLFFIRVLKFVLDEERVQTLGGIVAWGLFFVLWASPALGPIAYQQLFARPPDFNPDPSLFYILAEFRLPHHYLLGSFYLHNVVRFSLLGLAATGVLLWKPYRRQLYDWLFVVRTLTLIGIFCLIAWLFTEIVPVLLIAKLQLFKMTVLAKLLFVIVISGAIFYWLPEKVRRALQVVVRRPGWGLTITTIVWLGVIAAAVMSDGYLHRQVRPFLRAKAPIGRVQDWAQRRTPADAIFAIPPSVSTFRSEAHRTIVINYKSVPYDDEQMVVWFERLTDMAPIDLPNRGGPEILDELDAAYESLGAARLKELSAKYEFDYVVRTTPLSRPEPAFKQVFANDGWFVYEQVDNEDVEAPSGSTESSSPASPLSARVFRPQPVASR